MQCYIYCPETGSLEVHVLGSQVSAGDELQIAVPGGSWKAGELIPDPDNLSIDFSLVGEAVAPGRLNNLTKKCSKKPISIIDGTICFHTQCKIS